MTPEEWSLRISRMEQNSEDARKRLEVASDLALLGLRSLVLLNGGAIVALFTLVAQGAGSAFVRSANPKFLWWSFVFFALGAIFSLVANLIGYWSQQKIAVYEQGIANESFANLAGARVEPVAWSNTPNILLLWAMGCAIASLLCFLGGSGLALAAAVSAIAPIAA